MTYEKLVGLAFRPTVAGKSENGISKTYYLTISEKELQSTDDVLLKNGILFVGESNNKGEVLLSALKRAHWTPKKIVYVDDKRKHVQNMEKALGRAHIPFMGFRYGALDSKVAQYNEIMSEVIDEKTAHLFLMGQNL